MKYFVLVFLFLSIACSEDKPKNECGSGRLIEADGKVCLFTDPVEGQACPAGFSHHIKLSSDVLVCSPQPELSGSIKRRLETLGHVPREENNRNNNNANSNNRTSDQTNHGTTPSGMTSQPVPIRFIMGYSTASSESWYYQSLNRKNQVGWLGVRREGRLVMIQVPCGVSECNQNNAVECVPRTTEPLFESAMEGEVSLDWDGFAYEKETKKEEDCVNRKVLDPKGSWTVEFCIAPTVATTDDGGSELNGNVMCVEEMFSPSTHREVRAHF